MNTRKVGLVLLAFLLAACSIDMSGNTPPNTSSVASPTPLPWIGLHLAGQLIFIQEEGSLVKNGQVVKLDLVSGQTTTLFQSPSNAWPTAVAVSPDGKWIAMAYAPPPKDPSQQSGYTELDVLPIDASREPQPVLPRTDPQETFSFPQWSVDGQSIYYAHVFPDTTGPLVHIHFNYTIERVAYPNGHPQKILDDAIWPRLSPDGKQLAYVSYDQQSGENDLYVADVDGTHARLAVPARTFYAVDAPLFSPDSQTLLFTAIGGPASSQRLWSDQRVSSRRQALLKHNLPADWWRVNLATGKMESLTHIADTGMYGDFAPDGQHVAFVSSSGLFVMKPDGANLTRLLDPGPAGTVSWIR